MESTLSLVRQLVNDFREHEKAYLAPSYQESQVRQDFVDKFFTALGWDVSHQRQKNPYEQEVKIENRMRTEGTQRRADYAFFIAPNFRDVKFFVEAKKPAHDLANANYYYQTVRYGWNKTTPIAILTDFEEFHILDCRYKPNIKTVLDHKIEKFHYSQYADEEVFKKIFSLFGRDAVAGGSLEKFVETLPKPRGKAGKKGIIRGKYQPVDEAFLELLDGYRDMLAHAFKNKNPQLDGESLTEAVQRTLDRLVFIRFLEDKGIEEQSIALLGGSSAKKMADTSNSRPLQGETKRSGAKLPPNHASAWDKFLALCRSMEPKYNGLVFKQHPVIDNPAFVAPDDKTFSEICSELSDPTSPYDFNTIPISILGSIYERFLGKIVTTTEKRAKVVEKPEVRKAGGVYYTPEYIVRYIVSETVGKLLYLERPPTSSPVSTKTEVGGLLLFKLAPTEVAKLKIIDIACGSGSFLLEVYSQLLDYHTRYYNEFPEKAKKGDTETREGKLVLSHKKRQEILLNNIYGVDIDFQATEVTQLSLYLKLMEDVTMNDAYQFSLLKERMLPDLRRNIVCGNSLIGRDILDGKLFDDETERTLKPMNFEDVFPEIMTPSVPTKNVGTSPPYKGEDTEGVEQRIQSGGGPVRRSPESIRDEGGFDVVVGNPPYVVVKGGRYTGFEESKPVIDYYKSKFRYLQQQINIYVAFLEMSYHILKPNGMCGMIIPNTLLTNDYCEGIRQYFLDNSKIMILNNEGQVFEGAVVEGLIFVYQKSKSRNSEILTKFSSRINSINQNIFYKLYRKRFLIHLSDITTKLIDKILIHAKKLNELCEVWRGLTTGNDKKFLGKRAINKKYKRIIQGKQVSRYFLESDELFVNYEPTLLDRARPSRIFEVKEKLISKFVGTDLEFAYDNQGLYVINTACIVFPLTNTSEEIKYILGILNSKLLNYYFKNIFTDYRDAFPIIKSGHLEQLPIRTINFEDAADKARHDNIVKLVEQMLAAKAKYTTATTESEKNRLDIQIEALDRQIDSAVYELYGLSEEEIKIVEGNE